MSDFKVHADSSDINKIEGLLKEGFYIYNSMLVMELALNEYDSANVKTGSSDFVIEQYDSSSLNEYLKANALGFGKQDPKEVIEEELTYNNSAIYVLRVRGKIASSVTVWDHSEDTVSTENIFTVPKYRENHYATQTLDYVLKLAKARGMNKARLTVYGDDIKAIDMYYKFGFRLTKVLQELRPI